MGINEILLTVAIIAQVQNGKVVGSATGFFYLKDERLYLVTNKHVFQDDNKGVKPDSFILKLHTDKSDLKKNGDFVINLYDNGMKLWKTHSSQNTADVAIIEVDKISLTSKFIIKAFSQDSFLPINFALNPGEDVFIMGYPLGFHDNHNNLPILRNAMIASAYGVDFQGLPLFLTDANLHPGTSGSPVITKPKNNWFDTEGNTNITSGTNYYLVGIHSGTVNKTVTGGTEVGLGATWYAKLIDEIIN